MNTSFSFSAMIRGGWHIFKKHWKFIVLAGLATLIINIVLRVLQNGGMRNGVGLWYIIVSIFAVLVGLVIALGWSKVGLSLVRHDKADWDDFKTEPKVWLRYIKVTLWYLAYVIVFAVGLALPFIVLALIGLGTHVFWLMSVGAWVSAIVFIVVAIYFGIRYQFTNFATLDYPELSARNIFRKSGALTKGQLLQLLGFSIVLGLLNLAGVICLVVGLVITIPVTKLAQTKVYEYLKQKHEGSHHGHAEHASHAHVPEVLHTHTDPTPSA